MRRLVQVNLVAMAACMGMVVSAQAQVAEERMTLKFDTPLMVPGATLPPGTYVFRESKTGEDIVQIYNEDETRLMATTIAVPAIREDVDGDPVVTIQRTSATMAPALSKVFYPGRKYGHEFVYSEEQARKLADETRQIVLSHDAPEGSDLDALGRARLWKNEPGGQRSEYRREAAQAASSRGGAEQHLNRIEELLDRMLQNRTGAVGTTGQAREGQILVDRAQLEQIKTQLNQLRQQLEQQRKR